MGTWLSIAPAAAALLVDSKNERRLTFEILLSFFTANK
jgi:hypothetical protein